MVSQLKALLQVESIVIPFFFHTMQNLKKRKALLQVESIVILCFHNRNLKKKNQAVLSSYGSSLCRPPAPHRWRCPADRPRRTPPIRIGARSSEKTTRVQVESSVILFQYQTLKPGSAFKPGLLFAPPPPPLSCRRRIPSPLSPRD